jgi:hypothetical protein
MRLPFGPRNTEEDAHRLATAPFGSSPIDDEFVGMMGDVSKSFHDLLAVESEAICNSFSNGGSHQPSWECFMAGVPKGRVEDAYSGETPPSGPNNRASERNQAPPPARIEQLWERQNRSAPNSSERLDAVGTEGMRAAATCDVSQRILKDDEGLPCFPRASQNIAAAALLGGFLKQAMPEGRRAHKKLCTLIEHRRKNRLRARCLGDVGKIWANTPQ